MSFHLYQINELYTNADGSVQFIELTNRGGDNESFWAGRTLTVTQGGSVHSYTFPTNLPSTATTGTSVLVATQGFANLGLVTPNYVVPDNFLFTSGGATVNYAGVSSVSYAALPTDGVTSIDRAGATEVNSPTNFAGQTATIAPSVHLVTGTAAADFLPGTDGPDRIDALAGNDIVLGGGGDDVLIGGDGVDTAVYQGVRSAYTVAPGAPAVAGPEGVDALFGIERLHFVDRSLAFDAGGAAGRTEKLLSAVFGAGELADPVAIGIGLAKFDSGVSYEGVAELALHARLGPAPSNLDVVDLLYTNVAGTPPDPSTAEFFVGLLTTQQFTQASLTVYGAEHPANVSHVDLTGIAQNGLEYLPFAG